MDHGSNSKGLVPSNPASHLPKCRLELPQKFVVGQKSEIFLVCDDRYILSDISVKFVMDRSSFDATFDSRRSLIMWTPPISGNAQIVLKTKGIPLLSQSITVHDSTPPIPL